jgi:hypothetical protein
VAAISDLVGALARPSVACLRRGIADCRVGLAHRRETPGARYAGCMRPPLLIVSLILATTLASPVRAGDALAERLAALAPDIGSEVLQHALAARDCALAQGLAAGAERLAVIDFARRSTEPRLWIFDLAQPALLYVEHVAHGRGSGEAMADRFSNIEGSHQTSLGLFMTAEPYHGSNGYSLRLDGLEPGLNDRARERAIVMHGAPYVDPVLALRQGRLGRSFGCPAVRSAVARPIIDTLKEGQLLFAWHPQWRDASGLPGCGSTSVLAGGGAAGARAAR